MLNKFNKFLDRMSEYLANRKGLLPLIGITLVILNFVLQFFPGMLAETDLFLHLGVILAVLGIMLGWAL